MTVDSDPVRPGRYHANLEEHWNCPLVPHGGVVTALALSAMGTELGVVDGQRLRSVSTVFAGQVPAGPCEIDVTVLRRGRSMSQVTSTLRAAGQEAGHTAVAVFGGVRPGFEFTDVAPPDVPPPDGCPSWRDGPPEGVEMRPPFPFWELVEGRAALGHAPWEEYDPTGSERASWYRFDEPPIASGVLDPRAAVALCDTMPGAVGERLGRTSAMWLPPSVDLTVHVLGEARSEWLLGHNRARHAGDGYASVEITLWDEAGGLVAYGTQLMYFVFPDGPPAPDEVRARPVPDRPA